MRIRVSEGGHNIEPEVIERRYYKGIKNLFNIYLPLVDSALVFDNSEGKHKLVAEKTTKGLFNIIDSIKFNEIKSSK